MTTLTREQRNRLVQIIVTGAADTLGRAVELGALEAEGIDENAAYEQVARWLYRLPGDAWDWRLPDTSAVRSAVNSADPAE